MLFYRNLAKWVRRRRLLLGIWAGAGVPPAMPVGYKMLAFPANAVKLVHSVQVRHIPIYLLF